MPPHQPNNWIVVPKPNPGAKVKLFCLPFAGGSTVAFRTWSQRLPDFVELHAIEIPGRGHRLAEPLATVLENLVYEIASALRDQLDRPFAFFGHSMGALIGFELAHYLIQHFHKEPLHLFFSGRGAPDVVSKEKPIHKLPENQFVEEIKSYNGTPKEVLEHAELMQIMIPILRADFQICETYSYHRHRKILNCPMTIFGGLADTTAPKKDLEAWRKHTEGTFKVSMFPGDHFYLSKAESLLLEAISRDINASLSMAEIQSI